MQPQLTNEQQQKVLRFMEATNEQSFKDSVEYLSRNNFNLQIALNKKFNQFNQVESNQNFMHEQNDQYDRNHNNNDDEIVYKYMQYLQDKDANSNIFFTIYNFFKTYTISIIHGISSYILPQFINNKFFKSQFYKLYIQHERIKQVDYNLHANLNQTRNLSSKLCFLIINEENIKNEKIINLFSRNEILIEINQSYKLIGLIRNDQQLQFIPGSVQSPQIIICRKNVFEEIDVLHRFEGNQSISNINSQFLHELAHSGRNLYQRDRNVIIKYRNYINRRYYGHIYYDQEQYEQINLKSNNRLSKQIQQQNKQYKQFAQLAINKQKIEKQKQNKEQQKRKIVQQLLQERKVRKISIPNQPLEGSLIRFNFRCPNGSMKVRNFNTMEKLDLVYNWVETNQQIEFEDNIKRQFQLLHSFPPVSLQDRRQQILQKIFESDQEKLMIKQL